jgi:hypothetical protein
MLKNPINIIKKIKSKDKDLEGMWVAVDKYGTIIGFDKDHEEVEYMVGEYNLEEYWRHERMYKLHNIALRKKIKKYL